MSVDWFSDRAASRMKTTSSSVSLSDVPACPYLQGDPPVAVDVEEVEHAGQGEAARLAQLPTQERVQHGHRRADSRSVSHRRVVV